MAEYTLLNSRIDIAPDARGQTEYSYELGCNFPAGFKEALKFVNSMDISLRVNDNTIGEENITCTLTKPFYRKIEFTKTYFPEYANFGSYSLSGVNVQNLDIHARITSRKEFNINSNDDETYFRLKCTSINTDLLKPKNIQLSSTDCLQDITVSWTNENQDGGFIEVFQDEQSKLYKSITTEKSFVIPKNTLKKGSIIIQFGVYKTNLFVSRDGDTFNVNNLKNPYEHRVNLTSSEPEITEITTKELNIDNSRQISWRSNRQESYKLELNGATYTGAKETSCLIDKSHFVWGTNTGKLTISNVVNGITSTVSKEFKFTVTVDNPTVSALDPSGINVNVDKPVTVTWRTVPEQHLFTLKCNNNNYQGTTEQGVTIPVGVFSTGQNTITITATRNILEQVLTTTKTVNFTGYGKPNKPIFENKNIYNTALPTIHWESLEQTAFQVQIFENTQKIIDSNEVVSNNRYYTVSKNLKNNTKYIVKAKIKSKFNLWSDFAEKEFRTSFDVINAPTISLFKDIDGGIVINTTNQANNKFGRSEVWRKDDYSDWKRIGYNLPLVSSFKDNTIASNIKYYYKAITYTQSGGASESNIQTYQINIDKSFIVDIESNKSMGLAYSFAETQEIKIKRIQDRKVVLYQGKKAPDIEIGETDYKTIQIPLAFKSYTEFKDFEFFIDKSKVLMFKDTIGRKIYCELKDWGEEQTNMFGNVGITLNLVEVNFLEKDIFNGGRTLKLIRLDEGWRFDSGLTFDMNVYDE